ncbi:MAG TPA: efflux RND transporter periplasmic adaptor subunit [Gammaproteobacteria bacterium]|nr:efflux RND transporter periplasmic adaptor subunit [Gammaproteobacteria bacterium]
MRRAGWWIFALLAFGIGLGAGRWLLPATDPGMTHEPAPRAEHDERKVLYWYDPMRPDQHFDAPGPSPFMDMPLQPKYADEAAAAATVRIDPSLAQNLGVRLTRVREAPLPAMPSVPGVVQWNERAVAIVQTRAAGFVTRVFERAPGDVLERGAPLAELQIPEWAGPQAEYLALQAAGEHALAAAARARLAVLGVPAPVIETAAKRGKIVTTVRVATPIAGVLTALEVRRGMRLEAGQTLAVVNGLDPIWIEAAWPVARSREAVPGAAVTIDLDAYPGETLAGRIEAVLPAAAAASRTLRVRIELPNPGGRLRPGLFARVSPAATRARSVLQVPDSAVIRTGARTFVFVAEDGGRYRPVEVRLGAAAEGQVEVLDGLAGGQRIVESGQFLIDSEARLSGALAQFAPVDSNTSAADPHAHHHPAETPIQAIERLERQEHAHD